MVENVFFILSKNNGLRNAIKSIFGRYQQGASAKINFYQFWALLTMHQAIKRWRGVPGVTGTLGKANSHFDLTQTGPGTAPPRWGGCWLVQVTWCISADYLRFTQMVSFPKRYQFHQIGTSPLSGQSRHHRLPLVLHYSSSTFWGFSTSPTSHPDSFHSFILWAGSSSSNLFSYFRFGQTWSETKTLQIVLESFCVQSPAHASFYLF